MTVSRVFGALVNYTQNGGDWQKALEPIMPKKREEAKENTVGPKANGVKGKKKRTKRGGKKHRKGGQAGIPTSTEVAAS